MPFEPGQRAGHYEVLDILGKGGMGRVYRVRNIISNRIEAMKVLLPDLAAERELGERFLSEIRTLARLDHPNIAKFLTALALENQLVMIMEFVEGVTLSDAARGSKLEMDQVLSYVGQTLSALGYAHQNGVIHRDVKPSNIMITPHGVAKLMDFGVAKSNFDALVTRPGTTVGSMLYMSPEQVRGTQVDARSDIYSAGVVLYELAAGRRPFEADNTFGILEAQLNTAPPAPIEVNPSVPAALNEIILTAMQKDPAMRFANAEAFGRALRHLQQQAKPPAGAKSATAIAIERPVSGPNPAQASAARAQSGKRSLWMAVGAIAAVCVLAAGAFTLPHFFKSSAASTPARVPAAQSTSLTSSGPPPAAQPSGEPSRSVQAPKQPRGVTTIVRPTVPDARTETPLEPKRLQDSPPHSDAASPTPAVEQPEGQGRAEPSQAEVARADEEMMRLSARAVAVRSSLSTLRSQQAESGLGLRQDISAAASRMESYLQASNRAVEANNLDIARSYMDKADAEISKLEAFFGR